VLGRPSPEDTRLIGEAIDEAIGVLPVMIKEGAQIAMNRLHTRPEPPESNGTGK
jgi:peptidyl-tRNA hydrolase